MLESKVNQKSTHAAIAATINPFESLDQMPNTLEPRTPFPGSEGIPFDAEILYARRAAENNRHLEISRIETKFGKTITGFLYRTKRGSVALQCDTDGFKSVLQTGISFEALLTLPNLREPCRVVPIPDTMQFVAHDGKLASYVVTPDEGKCGCQFIFQHEYECRHLKAVYKYQAEMFQKKTPSDFPLARKALPCTTGNSTALEKWFNGEPLGDKLDEMVAKHHPDAICAPKVSNCKICGRELTDPESIKRGIGPECAQKIGNGKDKSDGADGGMERTGGALAASPCASTERSLVGLQHRDVSPELRKASQLWRDKRFQKWIVKGVLTLDAPLPVCVIPQKGMRNGETSYWGYSKSPFLYYLDADNNLHCIYMSARKLRHKAVPPCANELDQMALNELDQMALNAARDLIELLANNGGKMPRIERI